ncbi:MAG: glycosyltransferase family 4 protein [Thermoanaerobaculia bacterium]
MHGVRGARGRRRVTRLVRRAVRGALWYREQARLVAHLRRLRPDVVQLGDLRFGADLLPLAALRASGLRLADVCHNVRPFAAGGRRAGGFGAGRLSRTLYRRAYRLADVVFVHGEGNRRRFLDTWGAEPAKVRSIPLGSFRLFDELRDPAATPEALRRRLGLDSGAPVVLFFGTLARYKGVDLLVDAFARVRARLPEARLVVAGFPLPGAGGVAPAELIERARHLGVEEAVRVVPEYLPSPQVAAWMKLAAAAVFPYREISQSAALQVAASFGVPVVATAVGGTTDVVRNGETGLLVPAGEGEETVAALARALERLLRDRDLARRLGGRAAEEAGTRGSWRGVAREVLAAYRELLPEREGAG